MIAETLKCVSRFLHTIILVEKIALKKGEKMGGFKFFFYMISS